jgi:parvulin-like peptidyl-prolyl isomerase
MKRIKGVVENLKKKINGIKRGIVQETKTRRFRIISVVVLVLVLTIVLARFVLIAAVVNGQPITRIRLIQELERQGGQSILDNLIEKSLVYQEANKQNVSVSKEELDAEVKNIEDYVQKQGISLEQALSLRGQTKNDLVEQIKLQKLVEKMLGSKISISDEEISQYFEDNSSLYDKGTKLADVKDEIRETLFQQKLSEEYNTWIEELRTKAHILYFINF